MGSQVGKLSAKVSEQLEGIKGRVDEIVVLLGSHSLSAEEASKALLAIRGEIGDLDLPPNVLSDIQGKVTAAEVLIEDLEEAAEERRKQEAQDGMKRDAESQIESGKKVSNLVLIYSSEYGDGYGSNYVQQLLDAGKGAGGYRYPREGQDLRPISNDVHEEACKKATGVSNSKSTSNGLINRIREQSAIVTENAYKAGYNIGDAGVQRAMGNLARAIAFSLDSDSGARDYSKENNPRGMSYNLDTRVPGVSNPSQYTGAPSEDPVVLLDSHERALIGLRGQLNFTNDSTKRQRLLLEIARLEKEVTDLKKKLGKD